MSRKSRRVLAVLAGLALVGVAAMPANAIVGGYEVPEGGYAFTASLQSDGGHFCGGSVIAPQWVLTAAHCVQGAQPSDQDVVVGRTDLRDETKGQRVTVTEVHVHPSYDGTYDAALLELAEPVAVPAIALPTPQDGDLEADGTPLVVAGWGTTAFLVGPPSPKLKAANVKAVSDQRCETSYGLQGFSPGTEICAEELLADSCQGDSGGPLFSEKDGRVVQVGIVSYGLGCATPGFPGVYGEVDNPEILAWITTTAGLGGGSR